MDLSLEMIDSHNEFLDDSSLHRGEVRRSVKLIFAHIILNHPITTATLIF